MSSVPVRNRLPAAERRAAVLDAALRVFGEGSYDGATTAEIARAAGVSEPILYRHFGSKRDLYFACLDEMWRRLREAVEEIVAAEPDPREWLFSMPKAIAALRAKGLHPNQFWIQALSQAGEDQEIKRYVRKHMREVHDFVAGVYAKAQAAGAIPTDRDVSSEAWIGLGIGLLRSVQDSLGGLLTQDDFDAILETRRRSLVGTG
ncbi:MAG TPA: TetR/AcrR family transcriptional regulator [Gaiellaceae bacterium]|nr:TetR/AcrR family transcriptional regulator [Gaiellaceae bacterium]